MARNLLFFLICIALWMVGSCRKDSISDDPNVRLRFSADTLTFDTVFTGKGTVIGAVKVYNDLKEGLELSSIVLKGGTASQFRLNIDGVEGNSATDVIIPAKDSIYIFVEVTVDPTSASSPFIIGDDIQFSLNGSLQIVHLMAWGQNARYIFGEEICNEVWDDQLPYVIVPRVDPLTGLNPGVIVSAGCKLTIQAGTRVYFSETRAGMLVRGDIEILGQPGDSVRFEGIRQESFYDKVPGQWLGIFIYRGSLNNRIEHFYMDESRFGITVGVLDVNDLSQFTNASRPNLVLDHVIIKNNLSNALFGFNANIDAENCLFYRGDDAMVSLGLGGAYRFKHCTFYNSGTTVNNHDNAILLVSNFAADGTGTYLNSLDSCFFTNCIIWGTLDEEISLNRLAGAPFRTRFDHCLLKTELNTDTAGYISILKNVEPRFADRFNDIFDLDESSPCIDSGRVTSLATDLFNRPRPSGFGYDIGAFEHQ